MMQMRMMRSSFEKGMDRLRFRHPIATFLLAFIALPLFTLAAVALSTTVVVLPFACVFGWM